MRRCFRAAIAGGEQPRDPLVGLRMGRIDLEDGSPRLDLALEITLAKRSSGFASILHFA